MPKRDWTVRGSLVSLTVEMICRMVSFLLIDHGSDCYYLAIAIQIDHRSLGCRTRVGEEKHDQHFRVFSLFLSSDWLVVTEIGRCPLIRLDLRVHDVVG